MSIEVVEQILRERCRGTRADGERCRSMALEGEFFCVSHHPAYAKKRSRASKKAARKVANSKVPSEIRRIRGIQKQAQSLLDRQQAGSVDHVTVANAMNLLNVQLRALELEHGLHRHRPAKRQRSMRDRMGDLEQEFSNGSINPSEREREALGKDLAENGR